MEEKYKKKRYIMHEILTRVYGEKVANSVIKDPHKTNTLYILAYIRNQLKPEEIDA
jgi:hypothetical protein